MSSDDVRKDKRTPVIIKFRFRSATIDEFIEQYSRDISRGGIFVKHKEPLPVRTLVKFEFKLKTDQPVIRGVGRVVWTRDMAHATRDRPPGMGIKFIKLDDESRQLIERVVAGKESIDIDTGPPGGEDVATGAMPGDDVLTEAEERALDAVVEVSGPHPYPEVPKEPPKPMFPTAPPALNLPKEPPKPSFGAPVEEKKAEEGKPEEKKVEEKPAAEEKKAEEKKPEEKKPEEKRAEEKPAAKKVEEKPAEKKPAPRKEDKPAEKKPAAKPAAEEEGRSPAVTWILVLIIVAVAVFILWRQRSKGEEPTRTEGDMVAQNLPPEDIAPLPPAPDVIEAPDVPAVPDVPPEPTETRVDLKIVFSTQAMDVIEGLMNGQVLGENREAVRKWLRPLCQGQQTTVEAEFGGQKIVLQVGPGAEPRQMVMTGAATFPNAAFPMDLVFKLDETRSLVRSGLQLAELVPAPGVTPQPGALPEKAFDVELVALQFQELAPLVPVDAGAPPPVVDAGAPPPPPPPPPPADVAAPPPVVDAGAPPPPPADAGTRPPRDAGARRDRGTTPRDTGGTTPPPPPPPPPPPSECTPDNPDYPYC